MQTFYIGNSLLGDELAIGHQLISDILTCFAADALDRAGHPYGAGAPHRGALQHFYIDTSYGKDREPPLLWRKRRPILVPKLIRIVQKRLIHRSHSFPQMNVFIIILSWGNKKRQLAIFTNVT